MPDQNPNEPSNDKAVFTSIQPDAPSPIPQAGKGPGHKRRAIIIAIVLAVTIIVSFAVYYALTLGDQSA